MSEFKTVPKAVADIIETMAKTARTAEYLASKAVLSTQALQSVTFALKVIVDQR